MTAEVSRKGTVQRSKWIISRIAVTALMAAALPAASLSAQAESPAKSTATTPPPAAQHKPNVLLLILDDMNTRLGAYGATVQTPNIDRFARQGVRFAQAYTQWPVCGPSRASMLTGMRPDTIGRAAIYERFRCTRPDTVTLPQLFQQAGYQAVRVGKVYHQGVPSDIGRDGPDDPASWNKAINPSGLDKAREREVNNMTPGLGLGRANSWLALDAADEDLTDGMVASQAINQIRENAGRPFFLAVGFYRPHVPEIAPKRYFDLYPTAKMKLAKETPQTLASVLPAARNSNVVNLGMSEEQQRQMIAAYSAATSYADAQVGRVLKELDDQGLSKNTIVIILGDHGFLLGEHGEWQKSMLWEEATRFPLLVRMPGTKGNRTMSQPVEMVDVYPTIAELAGLAGPSGQLDGRSLAPFVMGKASRLEDRPAYSQILGGRSIRTARYRYTEWEAGRLGRELYDHQTDPREQHNLAENPRFAKLVGQLSAKLPRTNIEPRGAKSLSNPQAAQPRRGGAPIVTGCSSLEALME